LFGGIISFSYLCTTLPVDSPDGGGPWGGRVDSTALYIFIYPHFVVNMIIGIRPFFLFPPLFSVDWLIWCK